MRACLRIVARVHSMDSRSSDSSGSTNVLGGCPFQMGAVQKQLFRLVMPALVLGFIALLLVVDRVWTLLCPSSGTHFRLQQSSASF